jgi:hypothetical protein
MNKRTLPRQEQSTPHSIASSTLRDRQKIVEQLRKAKTNTIYFREKLGLISPAPRIKELRERGFIIATTPINARSQDGRLHRNVAEYCLISEPTTSSGECTKG